MPDYPIGFEPISTVALLTAVTPVVYSLRHTTERALAHFRRRGVESVAFTAMTPDDYPRLLRQAMEDLSFDAIVLVGGDPLVNAALQETAGSGIPLGIIPCGVGNDIARQYRIPVNPEEAAETVAEGFVTTSDLGKIISEQGDVRYFGTVLATGVDAHVATHNARWGGMGGNQRWRLGLAEEFLHMKWRSYRLELEGVMEMPLESDYIRFLRASRDGEIDSTRRLVIERPLAVATFGNGRTYGGGMRVCPSADLHDGLLDLTLVEKSSKLDYLRHLRPFLDGEHSNLPAVTAYRCRRAKVMIGSTDVPSFAEGVPQLWAPFTVSVAEAAGRFIVPAP